MFAQKRDGVSLKSLCVWIIMAALILSGLIFNATFRLTSTFENLTEATESQIALGKASHELMDASDYLTEKVQRFTVNGDLHFLEEYFKEAFETNRRESGDCKNVRQSGHGGSTRSASAGHGGIGGSDEQGILRDASGD